MMEVAGCPTSCVHCSAGGGPYAAMPLSDIARVLDEAHRFCEANGLAFDAFPLHEMMAHPEVSGMLELFHEHLCDGGDFQPIATTGVPLATRADWRESLETARALGTTTFWFAFHGTGETHDRIVNRAGAYRDTCCAIERVSSMGFNCGCNAFVSKASLGQIDDLMETLTALGMHETLWEIAEYRPTARSRLYQSLRPDLDDLLPIADRLQEHTAFRKDRWANVKALTEAAHVAAARSEGTDEADWLPGATTPDNTRLICRPDQNLHSGTAGLHGQLHGNLRRDRPEHVFQRALDCGEFREESLCFSADSLPSVEELARDVGDPRGTRIYPHPRSMRWRWLDPALAAHRRY